MRVVYLNPSGQMGGAEVALLDLIASMRSARPDWPLHLIVGAPGPLKERAERAGVAVTVLPFPQSVARLGDAGAGGPAGAQVNRSSLIRKLVRAGLPVVRYTRKLRAELNAIGADVIHTNGFKMHVLGARASRNKVPVVWHVRDYVGARPMMARLLRWNVSKCGAIITNSNSVADDVRTVCGGNVQVHPVLDAIDLRDFIPEGPAIDLDAQSGLQPAAKGTIKIGLLATMARWKGHETFLRAVSLLPRELNFRAYVIGGALYQTAGSQHDIRELRDAAEKLGISDRIGFTGFVESAAAAMRSLDIVVHASTAPEPFGLVIAEAMACGRALVMSEAGGAVELVRLDVDALGHKPGDAVALADRITRLAEDRDLRERMGKAGRETAERRFDRTRLAGEIIPIYEETLARARTDLKR